MTAAPSVRGPLALGIVGCIVMVLGLVAWSVRAAIVPAIVAPGIIDAGPALHPVQHPQGGVVARLLVSDGDSVARGDTLAMLEDPQLVADLHLTDRHLSDARARLQRLSAERAGMILPPDAPEAALAERLADQRHWRRVLAETQRGGFVGQARALAAHIAAIDEERALVMAELGVQEALLAQGLVPGARVSTLERDVARLMAERAALGVAAAQTDAQLLAVDAQLAFAEAQDRAATEDAFLAATARVAELAAQRDALAARQAALVLRAPVSGRVSGMTIGPPGSFLRPAEVAMRILASDARLTITAHVAPEDLRYLAPGQQADLRWAGQGADVAPVPAVVTAIAADALPDTATGRRFTRVTLEPIAAAVAALAPGTLSPGLSVDVYFLAPPRAPIAYLLDPLTNRMSRALRDP